ncbi:MAG: hypothetical protein IJP48_07250 [Synergistaceae bacterium]|nr:hypothetical protein [Synergistaceae bacterium]
MTGKISALLMLLVFTGCSYAADIDLGEGCHMPPGFSSIYITSSDGTAIQNAADNIQDRGTIILSGTFKLKRDINVKKSITIKGQDSSNRAVLDVSGINNFRRALRCEGDSINLENLIITGGYQFTGGGAKIVAKTAKITNCDIVKNLGILGGGGLHLIVKDLTLTNCNILSNDTATLAGGMIQAKGNVTMTDCTVSGNKISNVKAIIANGGGILFNECIVNMNNCEVTNNTVPNKGGGIYLISTDITLTNCDVSGNTADKDSTSWDIYPFNNSVIHIK